MATDLRTEQEPTVTSLVSGILHDLQELLEQQLALFRHEVAADVKRTKEAALSLVLGLTIGFVGVGLLCFMLVYLLQWAAPSLPLWGCFGIVGGVFTLVGGALTLLGKNQFESFNPLPDESAQALKENIQCLMNAKK